MIAHQKYNVNEASVDELAQIPGLDYEKAEAIVEFRERRGGVYNLEELTDMDQVDPQEISTLREWLTLASESSGSLEFEGQKEEPDIV